MIPEFHYGTLIHTEHIVRYMLAARLAKGKTVLDVASGVGYGTELLKSAGAAKVVGIDCSREAVLYGQSRHFSSHPDFAVGDAEFLPLADSCFDLVVSFETIEHVRDHLRFLSETKRVLRRGGVLILSTPNRGVYLEGNPFHTKEFTFEELRSDLSSHFAYVQLLAQDNWITSAVLAADSMKKPDVRLSKNTALHKVAARDVDRSVYIVALCSDEPLPGVAEEAVLGDIYELQAYVREVNQQAKSREQQTEQRVAEKDASLARAAAETAMLSEALQEAEERLAQQEEKLRYLWWEITTIRESLGYRLLRAYRKVMTWLFPPGAIRGVPYRLLLRGLRRLAGLTIRSARLIRREGPVSFGRKAGRRVWARLRRWQGERHAKVRRIRVPSLDTQIRPLAFPKVASPKISIVIPVYNKAVYTYNCLKSVLSNSGNVAYEVIVVNDGSTDDTEPMLAQMTELRVVTNAENSGFLMACNKGIAAASGEYVVLLNNDTHVGDGWLPTLLETIERDATVGMVGAKLIYPTGKLQEAGGIVWSDASTCAYGRDDDPAKPQYNYVREVDYCSAACVIVRRELLEKTGAFDTRFAPAYYEDTDLAFQIRALGYRILYQPKAQVIHREGTSSEGGSSERLQKENRPLFMDKWRDVLAREHLPAESDPYLARDRRRGKRVLVVDYHVPTHDRGGGEFRMYCLLQILHKLGYTTTLLPGDLVKLEPYTEELQQLGIEVLYGDFSFQEIGPYIDVAIVSRPEVAQHYFPLVRKHAPQATLYYDTVDLHYVREMRRADVENDEEVRREADRLREMELWAARESDGTFVVSPAETEILARDAPGVDVHVVTNIHPVVGRRKAFAERKDLLFVGYYPHLPNRDAVRYFVKDILPLVQNEIPDIRLYVVGPEPGPELEAIRSDSVIVTGWVKELEPYLDNCRVFISPLRYGAGVKGKIGTSFAHGLPVVTTTIGAEGMGLMHGDSALIADDPARFAREVVRLYTQEALWTKLSDASLRLVDETYSPGVVGRALEALVQEAPGGLVGVGRSQCNICGSRAGFHLNGRHPKEGYRCFSCGSISRDRMLMAALGMCLGYEGVMWRWGSDESLAILETSGFRAHPAMLDRRFKYVNLIYDGWAERAIRGDLQCLPLQDESVDVVLSAEVFEHVRDDMRGFGEVARILKPGGYFLLQVPAVGDGERSTTLVEVDGDRDVFIRPPEYHADHTLVYRYYGNDLVGRLAAFGLSAMLYHAGMPIHEIKQQALIIAQKADYLKLGTSRRET